MKIIRNETNLDSKVIIEGTEYSVEANSISEPLNDDIAIAWKKIHGFLVIESIPEKQIKQEVKEEPKIIKNKKVK